MFKVFEAIESIFKMISENLARSVDRKVFLRTFSAGLLVAFLSIFTNPLKAFGFTPSWCGVYNDYSGTHACNFTPYGPCSGCTTSSKCPSGYSVDTYIYPNGCWCNWGDGWVRYCCDCIKDGQRCGCSSLVKTA